MANNTTLLGRDRTINTTVELRDLTVVDGFMNLMPDHRMGIRLEGGNVRIDDTPISGLSCTAILFTRRVAARATLGTPTAPVSFRGNRLDVQLHRSSNVNLEDVIDAVNVDSWSNAPACGASICHCINGGPGFLLADDEGGQCTDVCAPGLRCF